MSTWHTKTGEVVLKEMHSSTSVGLDNAEVECRLGLEHLIKDLRNLRIMRDRGYQTLILLLFANSRVPWPKLRQASTEAGIDLGEITVLLHRAAGQAATRELPPDPTGT